MQCAVLYFCETCSSCTFVQCAVLYFCETCSSHAVLALSCNVQFFTFVKHAVLALSCNVQFFTFVKPAVHMQFLHFRATCSSCTFTQHAVLAQHAALAFLHNMPSRKRDLGFDFVCKKFFGFSFCLMVKSEIMSYFCVHYSSCSSRCSG